MSLMKMIVQYDSDREAYIRKLEKRIETLEAEAHEASSLMMKGESLRSRFILDAILAGAYDASPSSSTESDTPKPTKTRRPQ